MFDLGDTVQLEAKVRDAAGELANADDVTLVVTLPDGSTESQTVTNPPATPGEYLHSYVSVQAGRYSVRWTFTGTVPDQAYADVFDVREASPPYIISLAVARNFLRITTDDNEDLLRGFVESTTRVIEKHPEYGVGPVVPRTVVERHYDVAASALFLYQYPVLEVTSVASVFTDTMWETADLVVDEQTGMLNRADGRAFCDGPWNTTYQAGRRVVPANFTDAAKIILKHLWSTRRVPDMRQQPNRVTQERRPAEPPAGFAIPNAAIELLAPDSQHGKASVA